jgi:hypothetical protein
VLSPHGPTYTPLREFHLTGEQRAATQPVG